MQTILILAQKGGAGKTTLAVHLAVAAAQAGLPSAILDTDPQASAAAWGNERNAAPFVHKAAASGAGHALRSTYDPAAAGIWIVDTAPASSASAALLARLADLILIPCRPSAFDFAAIGSTVQIVRTAGKQAAFVLNACPPGNPLAPAAEIRDTREALAALGYPVCPVEIFNRRAYSRAVISGEAVTEFDPAGKAADEIRRLWKWTKQELNHGK